MMLKFRSTIIWSLFILCASLACNTQKSEPEATTDADQAPVQTEQPATVASSGLTSIGSDVMRDLWQNCDAIDIIFYKTNFSLSQDEKKSIQGLLGYFLPSAVTQDPKCKPMGRLTFLAQGEIRREADIYLSETCQYFIWMDGNTQTHINAMAPQGISFFNQILEQGRNAQK